MVAPYATLVGVPWSVRVDGLGVTVKLALPDEAANALVPAKLAPTPVGYVPAAIVPRFAVVEATPELLVVAEPAAVPLSVKLTDTPTTGLPPLVRVPESAAVPPKLPEAGDTTR